MKQLRARISKSKSWIDTVKSNALPQLYDVLSAILNPGTDKPYYKRIVDLKLAAKTLAFIQDSGIADLPALADKVSEMRRDFSALNAGSKAIQKRITTLEKHLEQSENYNQYRRIAAEYSRLSYAADSAGKSTGLFAKSKAGKTRETAQNFYESHRAEIELFRTAERYMKGVLQTRFDPKKSLPIAAWRGELAEKQTAKVELDGRFHKLRDEIHQIETIKRFSADLMIPDEPKYQQEKSKLLEAAL